MLSKEIEAKLKAPFPAEDIEFRIAAVSGDQKRIKLYPYLTSRAIMDRLDKILGIENWSDEYELLASGVTCRLTLRINESSITKQDAASFTDIEALKGAFSDALKRAAVKFGIGRYLYKTPAFYVDLLPEKPGNNQERVHFFKAEGVSGWWKEPTLPSSVLPDKEKNILKGNFRSLTLYQKLRNLADLGIISEQKHAEYLQKLHSKNTGNGLIKYFNKQCDLLYNLYTLSKRNKITKSQKGNLYQRIMSSKLNRFPVIEEEIKQLEEAA
ncbi:MAG: hypothetical protein K9M95_11775 [Candidatus Cloacimonetes bacterium]|nr:hypothetical protein [Candidatus Cloacimonadota bacterium]MCF7884807.1 hypothetical protein [Candidatus Cloacimonadota bacterium]